MRDKILLLRRLWRIDNGTEGAILEGSERVLEDDALVVTFAVPLRLGTIVADGPALIALDAALSTSFTICQRLRARWGREG